jgi:Fe-S cluster assembly protein SufD
VFTGRVIVRRDSQRTRAEQENKNLLLSDGATANARPQLEIYADDVSCSHGSATGRIDDEALFYLRQRGVSTAQARGLLTLGFATEVVDTVANDAVRALVADRVDTWLGTHREDV